MTGFGYDPSHSIVKARQEGLQTVLYKPFRADRLMEAVEQALRSAPAKPATGSAPPSTVSPTHLRRRSAAAGELRHPEARIHESGLGLARPSSRSARRESWPSPSTSRMRSGFAGECMDRVKVLLLALTLVMTAVIAWEASRKPWSTWPWPASAYALACLAIALVGLPASTLARILRRQPPGISVRDAEIDLAQRNGTEVLIGTGKHAWMLRLPGNESFRLRKRDWDVVLPSLPVAWDGLSLLQISDLHFAPCLQPPVLRARGSTRRRPGRPTWSLFTGDLIDHDAAIDWIVPVLSRLEGRLGSYRDPGEPRLRPPPPQDPPGAGRGRLHRPGRAMDDARPSRA